MEWKRLFAGVVAAVLTCLLLMQSDVGMAAAESGRPGVSEIKLTELHPEDEVDVQSIDQAAEEGMKRYRIPGLAVGIVKDGRVVYLKGYGKADESGRRVTPQTPFVLGSVSKSFTALAVMQLEEKGKLELDKEASDYLPGLRLAVPEGGRAITVRDLLQHTSGLSMYAGRSMLNAKGSTLKEVVQLQGSLEANESPSESFEYSNANYILLGAIIEQVSGMSYTKYMEEHIFKPLEMTNSFADPPAKGTNGMASGYQRIFGRQTETHPAIRPSNVPAGYLIASTEDMTRYLIAQMEGGRYRDVVLLSEEGMKTMHRSSSGYPYGMGWFITPSAISHGGDAENFHADVLMLPKSGWGIVVLMNTNDVFMTSLYGNVYEALSFGLLQAATDGSALPIGLPEIAPFGPGDRWMNALVALLALWAAWALLRLGRKRSRVDGFTAGVAVKVLWISALHIGLPLIFLLRFPYMKQAPWATIMLFMPGWGHVLFIVPLVLLVAGFAEGAIGAWRIWRWRR